MLSVAVFVALFTVTFSQTPTPCITPPQWTGLVFELDPGKQFERILNLTYDSLEQRIYAREFDEEQEQREVYEIWYFYEKKEGFKINLRNPQVCEKFTITREWRPFGVPADATYTGIRYLGEKGVSSGTGIALEHWTHNYALAEGILGHFGGGFTRLRTAEGFCVPVLDGFHEIRQTAGQPDTLIDYVHRNIYDVVGRIDTAVFNIPAACVQ
jgi:hypothetical protein